MNDTTHDPTIKLCECGCGEPAPIARQTDNKRGVVQGQPIRFIAGHHNKVRHLHPLTDRFWKKVDKHAANGCWLWTAALDRRGYGVIGIRRKIFRAHRIAWELTNGPIPDGLQVLHQCDNPRCVKPAHLFLGTRSDNMADMVAKGRNFTGERPRGEKHGNAKLTEKDVKKIRQMKARKVSPVQIAKQFQISVSTVHAIATYKIWKHI